MSVHDQLNPPADVPVDQTGESSLAQQSFKEECDINRIMAQYQNTGTISPNARSFRDYAFGQFDAISDFQGVEDAFVKAQEAFLTLPADIRARFNNSVETTVDWLGDPANLAEAQNLGIISGALRNDYAVMGALLDPLKAKSPSGDDASAGGKLVQAAKEQLG